jgi:hypothetical protein
MALVLASAMAVPVSALTPPSDRLTDIDRSLAAQGYHGSLSGKEHAVAKFHPDGMTFSVILWMRSPTGTRLRDARQIKFAQTYCDVPGFSAAKFFAVSKAERDAFFREVIGQAAPAGLDSDISTITYADTKYYTVPHFRKVRLVHRGMKCDTHGGEAYELDFFP